MTALRSVVLSLALVFAARDLLGQQWEAVRIPQDSIQPLALKFSDSLHGYFFGVVPYAFDDGSSIRGRGRYSWYRTSDGGKSWTPIDFGGLFHGDGHSLEHDGNNRISVHGNTIMIYPGSRMTNLKKVLLISTDRGVTWREQTPAPEGVLDNFEFKAAFSVNHAVGIARSNGSGFPVVSFDWGKTFQYIEGDETWHKAADSSWIDLDCSTPEKWTAFIDPGLEADTTELFKYAGLSTLVTANGGSTWEFHHYYMPGDSLFRIALSQPLGPRFVKGTSSLYVPTHQLYFSTSAYPFKLSDYYANRIYFKTSWNPQKTSYLYSPDYGATWQPDTTFYRRRVAFEATAPGEVWMTLWRNEDFRKGTYADVIVHTTDYGKTWITDSTTLHPSELAPSDGSIICFSDRRHGWIAAANESGTKIFRYVDKPASTFMELPDYGYYYTLYPNPADESFTAQLAPIMKLERIELYDVLGRKYYAPFKLENNTAHVDCSTIPHGNYFVRMIAKQGNRQTIISKPLSIQ